MSRSGTMSADEFGWDLVLVWRHEETKQSNNKIVVQKERTMAMDYSLSRVKISLLVGIIFAVSLFSLTQLRSKPRKESYVGTDMFLFENTAINVASLEESNELAERMISELFHKDEDLIDNIFDLQATNQTEIERKDLHDRNHHMKLHLFKRRKPKPVKNPKDLRVVEFPVCGGLSNQRIALLMGITLASLMKRMVVLPLLQEDFIENSTFVPFDRFYDSDKFIRKVPGNVKILKKLPEELEDFPVHDVNVHLKMLNLSGVEALRIENQMHQRIRFDCPFFALDLKQNKKLTEYAWEVDRVLSFNQRIMADANKIINTMPKSNFVFLHVRIEKDWKDHCKVWVGDNCYTDPEGIKHYLIEKKIPIDNPFYIAGSSVDDPELEPLRQLNRLVSKESILSDYLIKYGKKRDLLAAVDFAVADLSDIFVGNSVSTFSALQILKRIDDGRKHYHYNEGIIPLQDFVPSVKKLEYRLNGRFAWVFALNDRSSAFDEMAKVAVASAYLRTTMKMYCLYDGSPNEMTKWMESHGVKVIFHKLSWIDTLKSLPITYKSDDKESTNYASPEALAATFIRTDIPILSEFQDEDYVLYTDVDVMFLRDVRPADVTTWPAYFGCGPEDVENLQFPCNMGIMLMNLQSLRSTYRSFLAFILKSPNLRFVDGPADQGAYNGFYKGKIDALSPTYNWKPYWLRNITAKILHFHGPKPADYKAYLHDKSLLNPLFRYLLMKCETGECMKHYKIYTDALSIIQNNGIQNYLAKAPWRIRAVRL